MQVRKFINKLHIISQLPPGEERNHALDTFFGEDLIHLDLPPGSYVFHDKTHNGVRRRDFYYSDENGSDVIIHVHTGTHEKISIAEDLVEGLRAEEEDLKPPVLPPKF